MPHTRSAKKRLRQYAKRQERNLLVKKDLKIQIKSFMRALDAGNLDQARQDFNLCVKRLDRAARKRVIHPNKAARKKSQLARKLNAKSAGGATTTPTTPAS